LTNQTKIGINICCGSGKKCKNLILSKNLIWEPHVRVFQKPQKYFFIDQNQKLNNQAKIGANMVPEYSQKRNFSAI
jgi:hypothetical protein